MYLTQQPEAKDLAKRGESLIRKSSNRYLTTVRVAFRAKPTVAAAAKVTIDHGDLTALLYLQGYKKSDFASA